MSILTKARLLYSETESFLNGSVNQDSKVKNSFNYAIRKLIYNIQS